MDKEVNESSNEKQNAGHAEDLIKLSASCLLSSQAKETSSKSPQSGNDPVKKVYTNTNSNSFSPSLKVALYIMGIHDIPK